MKIAVSAQVLIGAFVLLVLLILGLIVVMRWWLARTSEALLSGRHPHRPARGVLDEFTKYREVDVFQFGSTFFNLSLAAALVIAILAFSWTVYDQKVDVSQYMDTLEQDIEIEPPRTAEPPPPPPPPPPSPLIQEVPDELITEEEDIEFMDQSVDDDTYIERPAPVIDKPAAPPPPPPPPPPKEEPDEIFKVVEEMPTFPGCESISDKAERKTCVDQKLLEFIYSNIKYPVLARDNGVQGLVVVNFVVEKDGSITDIQVVRDIGAGCGEEAVRIVKMMPKWNPGKQRGRPVRVRFTLPIRFKLE